MARERGDGRAMQRWSKRITARVVPEKHAMLHAKIHMQLADGLIADSAVGNPSLWQSPPPPNYAGGRFKGNWQSSIGGRVGGETGRIDPGGGATITANQAALRGLRPFALSVLQNNVPYAARLNQSPPHTTQMAPGFVQRNLQRVRVQFSKPTKGGR